MVVVLLKLVLVECVSYYTESEEKIERVEEEHQKWTFSQVT